jgi:hypothetical protein
MPAANGRCPCGRSFVRKNHVHRFCSPTCRGVWGKRKPKSEAAGYGRAHRRERERWTERIARGFVSCARCGKPIVAGMVWHLDHTDDRRGYLGASHAYCNTAAAARKLNASRSGQAGLPRRGQSQVW